MPRFLSYLSIIAVGASLVLVPPSPAESTNEHCITRVLGTTGDGELLLEAPTCVSADEMTRQALVATTLGVDAELAATGTRGTVRFSGSVLAVHYDGIYSGSSLTVTGSGCNGGWVNLSAYWSNRVSSTINGICARVKHHDYANKGGSYQSTWGGGGTLSYMNNRANSISYNMS